MFRANRYMGLAEAARALGTTPDTLARWILAGRFPAYRTPGGHYRIAVEDLPLALEPARTTRPIDSRGGRP